MLSFPKLVIFKTYLHTLLISSFLDGSSHIKNCEQKSAIDWISYYILICLVINNRLMITNKISNCGQAHYIIQCFEPTAIPDEARGILVFGCLVRSK